MSNGLIRLAIPIRFDRRAETGRNRSLLVAVETDDGREHEVFLKASGAPELGAEGLMNEALAARLAADLGLPVAEPFLVEILPDWAAGIPDAGVRVMLERSAAIAFGSEAAGPQWRTWSAGDRLNTPRRPGALAILAFDAYIDNPDRTETNPNCLVKGDAFRIIDHDLAFRIRQKLFPPPEPWKPGYLERLTQPGGHIFGAGLKGRNLDFGPVWAAWSGLSDKRLQDYRAMLPSAWAEAVPAMEAALTHLRAVRDRINDCLAELERSLR
jgi:hypothetical protein